MMMDLITKIIIIIVHKCINYKNYDVVLFKLIL